jgi:hypothetical protein
MSNQSDWISWVTSNNDAGTLPLLADAIPLMAAIIPTVPPDYHDDPDQYGLVNIPALGEDRWAVEEIEPLVLANQTALYTLIQNIQNARFASDRQWIYNYVLPAVHNNLTGGWQLAPYEQKIPNARVSIKKTVAETIAFYGKK